MIKGYFNLREEPFGVTPDPRFIYFTPSYREALASLYYGIQAGRGFLGLIAPPGMGKTTLLFHLLSKLGSSVRPVYIFQTQCDSHELLRGILHDLGLRPGASLAAMNQQISAAMAAEFRLGRQLLLVVDEAQNLDAHVLESLRLLSDFETPRAKMLQIIVAGQPQLVQTLLSPEVQQFKQRIAQVARIAPFNRTECNEYIVRRLAVAGHQGDPLFTDAAIYLAFEHSRGVPRIINHLCFNALSICIGRRLRAADSEIMAEAIADQDLSSLLPQPADVMEPVPLNVVPPEIKIAPPPAAVVAMEPAPLNIAPPEPKIAAPSVAAVAMESSPLNVVPPEVKIAPRPAAEVAMKPVQLGRGSLQFSRPVYLSPEVTRRSGTASRVGRAVLRFAAAAALLASLGFGFLVALDGKLPLLPETLVDRWRLLRGVQASAEPQPPSEANSNSTELSKRKTRQHNPTGRSEVSSNAEGPGRPSVSQLPRSSKQ